MLAAESTPPSSTGAALVALAAVIGLIIANALFVAAEFGLVAARRGVIEERARAGERRAKAGLQAMSNLSFVLSSAQFGITASSLVVGFLAEDSIAALLAPLIEGFGLPESTALGVSLTAAFVISTIVQMIFGELAPKNLAIAKPEATTLALGGFMRAFGIVFGPLIRLFDEAAKWVSTRAFRVEHQEELLGGASADEIARIVAASEAELTEAQSELLTRAIGLGDLRVSEIMVARPDITWLDRGATLEQLRDAARHTGHSRFPVRGDNEDDVLGTVHVKDLLQVAQDGWDASTVDDVVTAPITVPETFPIRRLLGELRQRNRTFAIVIDEYGGTAGIVTLEDVLEELVGEIEDEFDRDVRTLRRLGAGRYLVHGTLRADRLEDLLGLQLAEGDYETVAGFVLHELGRIPEIGDDLVHDGWRFTVTNMSGHRINELQLTRVQREVSA